MVDSTLPSLTSGSAIADTDFLYAVQGGGTLDRKIPPKLLSDYAYPVVNAARFSGATAGDKIKAAIDSLPSTGGIVDARALPTGGTIPAITIAGSGYVVLLPPGVFTVTGTIQLYNASGVSGISWRGCGSTYANGGTKFLWGGNSTDPMFRLRGVQNSELRDFSVQVIVTNPCAEVIRLETATGTVSTRRTFKNIVIDGIVSYVTKGFRWCIGNDATGGAGTDQNNDLDSLYDVQVTNYGNTAYSIEGSQSKTHSFYNCSFQGNGTGQRGVATTQAANSARNSGSFRWYGGAGGGGGNTVADFDLGSPDDNIVIHGGNWEASNRLLQTAQAFGTPWSILIEGCRWACNALNADNKVVNYLAGGSLVVNGNSIENAVGRNPQFVIASASGVAVGFASGNTICWDTAAPGNQPFAAPSAAPGWTTFANMMHDTTTSNTYPVPNLAPGALGAEIMLVAKGVNFNSANTDTTIPVVLPGGVTSFLVSVVLIANASAAISTATAGLFTAAAGGGVPIVTAATAITVSTASANTNNNTQSMPLNNPASESYNATNLFFRVAGAQGSAATADVIIHIRPLP